MAFMSIRIARTTFLVLLLFGGAGLTAQPPTTGQPAPRILIDSLAGRDSFELYCASCHGSGGRGDGPVASALRTAPPDLTTLAQRGGGTFPAARVQDFIIGTGRALAAHGTTEMPVWGPMFRAFESDARARERLQNLVTHIESLQRPTSGPGDSGAQAFRTYCASCHGASGRGDGPIAGDFRRRMPDLTQYSARNGGVFPSERLQRIIDGRDITAHGTRDMPVWGDAFRLMPGGLSEQEIQRRIESIMQFLRAVQERPA
jgi:mono/diheme cytochrome c family protein